MNAGKILLRLGAIGFLIFGFFSFYILQTSPTTFLPNDKYSWFNGPILGAVILIFAFAAAIGIWVMSSKIKIVFK